MLNVGDQIKTYGAIIWRDSVRGSAFGACKPVILCDDWDQANLRWEDPVFGFKRGIACNVTITGKTVVTRNGAQWLRAKLEWVKEDEPNTHESVLVRINWDKELELTTMWNDLDYRRVGEVKK